MPAGLIDPVAEYDHTAPHGSVEQGEAIVGGFVYRGSRVPALAGKYVFGDYSRVFGKPEGRLFYMCASPDVTHRVCNLVEHPGIAVFGFARDAAGELYVLGNRTGVVSGDTGVVESEPGGRLQCEDQEGLLGPARQPCDREERDDRYLSGHEELPEMRGGPFVGLAGDADRSDVTNDQGQGDERHRQWHERARLPERHGRMCEPPSSNGYRLRRSG